jgi:hypothetical protein
MIERKNKEWMMKRENLNLSLSERWIEERENLS